MDLLGRIKSKNLQTWMRGSARHLVARARAPRVDGTRHLLFALCDHYEPLWGKAAVEVGRSRVKAWEEGYPRLAQRFRDADGRPPRHSSVRWKLCSLATCPSPVAWNCSLGARGSPEVW